MCPRPGTREGGGRPADPGSAYRFFLQLRPGSLAASRQPLAEIDLNQDKRRESVRMRASFRVLVASLALFAAAGCGADDEGDDGGEPTSPPATTAPAAAPDTVSLDDVCAGVEDVFDSMEAASEAQLEAIANAAESGGEELADAQAVYVEQAQASADEIRAIAGTAEDAEVRSAMETFADQIVAFATSQAENGSEADMAVTMELFDTMADAFGHCE
jgi:hypothetical protein